MNTMEHMCKVLILRQGIASGIIIEKLGPTKGVYKWVAENGLSQFISRKMFFYDGTPPTNEEMQDAFDKLGQNGANK